MGGDWERREEEAPLFNREAACVDKKIWKWVCLAGLKGTNAARREKCRSSPKGKRKQTLHVHVESKSDGKAEIGGKMRYASRRESF